jgi:hypothetical protein
MAPLRRVQIGPTPGRDARAMIALSAGMHVPFAKAPLAGRAFSPGASA